jgi:AcrR family transcriptional regulator
VSSPPDPATQRILNAALTLFARHGFQRTSMADVARAAGIARATLYLRYSTKRALFEALASARVDEALAGAQAAWCAAASLTDNIAATLLAKDLGFFHMLNATPHGAELLEVDADLTARHVARLDAGFVAILVRRGAGVQRSGADLSAFGGPEGFAAFLATAGAGLKHETRTEDDYRTAVRRLARVAARAAGQP